MDITNPNNTIGEITKFEFHVNGTEAYILYEVNGKKYHHWSGSSRYKINVIGEKFEIEYDPVEPEKSSVKQHKPIFLPNEETDCIKGKIVSFYYNDIRFQYSINGKNYIKSQNFLNEDLDKYKQVISVGDSCLIRYWISNPKRAILQIDELNIDLQKNNH